MKLKKLSILLLGVIIATSMAVSVSGISALAYDTTPEDWGAETFSELNYGIYWYDGSDSIVPTKDYQINKDAPTIIYTHGWKPYGESGIREDLSVKSNTDKALSDYGYSAYPYNKKYYQELRKLGYNVGVFYWQQFADENKPALKPSIDMKVWSHNTSMGMQYVTYAEGSKNGVITKPSDPTNPTESVAVLYGKAIKESLGSDYNGKLHLVGHSVGGQLTAAVSEYLCYEYDDEKIGSNLLPERVTLIDPFMSSTLVTGTITHTGEEVKDVSCAELAARATNTIREHGIPIEGYGVNLDMVFRFYGSPALGIDEEKAAEVTATLEENCAWVYLKGMSDSKFGSFSPSHVMAVDYYFTTLYLDPVTAKDGMTVPSIKMPTATLTNYIGTTYVQTCSKSENSLYQTSGSYYRADFNKFEEKKTYRLVGTIEPDRDKEVVAKLYNEEGKEIAECKVDGMKRYAFEVEDATAKYTVKYFTNGMEVGETNDVSVDTTLGITIVPGQPLILGSDDILFVALVAILATLAVVIVVGLLGKVISNAKRKKRSNRA